jgi:hypothetical protein
MEKQGFGYFVGIPIISPRTRKESGAYAHVTIALNVDCGPRILQELLVHMKKLTLPIVMIIDPTRMLIGHDKNVPAHAVHFPNADVHHELVRFYETFYKQKAEFDQHPTLNAHVTVDSEERAAVVNEIITQDFGVYVAKTIELKKLGEKDTVFAVIA